MATKTSTSASGKVQVTPKMVRDLRRDLGWTAHQFGEALGSGLPGYSRSYVVAIERRLLPITERFATRFSLLRARVIGERVQAKDIISRHRLPRRLVIAPKPKRCPVCKWHFVGVTPIQKYCGKACTRQARQARGKEVSK